MTPLRRSVKLGMVLRKLIYGLNTAMFESRQELPGLMTGNEARGALMGVPRNVRGPCGPCLETSPEDEHNRPDDA